MIERNAFIHLHNRMLLISSFVVKSNYIFFSHPFLIHSTKPAIKQIYDLCLLFGSVCLKSTQHITIHNIVMCTKQIIFCSANKDENK